MIKLVRICNSRTNAPELEKIPKSKFRFGVEKGYAVDKDNDTWEGAGYYPMYIVAKTPKENDNYVYAIRTTPQMIFLANCVASDSYKIGDYVGITTTSIFASEVTVDGEGAGRIIDTVPGTNLVYVIFDRKREYDAW